MGTWALTESDKLLPDGTRASDFGDNPHGLVIFTADGQYSVEIYRADRAKFSSDDRAKVSTEEYKDAALGMSVHFGRYTVDPDKHTITFQTDRASWPNWDDTVQVRTYELKGNELSWKVARRPDGSIPITPRKTPMATATLIGGQIAISQSPCRLLVPFPVDGCFGDREVVGRLRLSAG